MSVVVDVLLHVLAAGVGYFLGYLFAVAMNHHRTWSGRSRDRR